MTTSADIETLNNLIHDAKKVILEKIAEAGGRDGDRSRTILVLAEAYAWVAHPNQPHGGQQ
jgi:hypothetical protein